MTVALSVHRLRTGCADGPLPPPPRTPRSPTRGTAPSLRGALNGQKRRRAGRCQRVRTAHRRGGRATRAAACAAPRPAPSSEPLPWPARSSPIILNGQHERWGGAGAELLTRAAAAVARTARCEPISRPGPSNRRATSVLIQVPAIRHWLPCGGCGCRCRCCQPSSLTRERTIRPARPCSCQRASSARTRFVSASRGSEKRAPTQPATEPHNAPPSGPSRTA